ncbi:N-acetyltransferase family protein [Rufibacter glacialis]|uniref:GNAT family N-acetyltransferase n=1 Tax=Rufibacter glacialis TaxID=1259555 RepID=A0A5M8QTF0_9BACT|nr:GNAT family N-acetyltransferase [Rufibacter glacialis]KAA6438134.1 GNAT family N-acetyltransferase [Rufibacter glacialis]GGK88923.1 N-acetyltransferase [Rufibacter glacialis]
MSTSINIRKGTEADLPGVHALIVELAVYEKAPDEVTNTIEDMRRDGFGENPIYEFFVADSPEEGIVGIALYYTAYSTWKGKMLFLEDIVVTERLRRQGIGRLLFYAVAKAAKEENYKRMKWQVLDWNEPAINFYRSIGANLDAEWVNCNLSQEELQRF